MRIKALLLCFVQVKGSCKTNKFGGFRSQVWVVQTGSGSRLGTEIDVVRFEVFTAVTMKNGVFWVVTLGCCSLCCS
jgi:hypothetical protein